MSKIGTVKNYFIVKNFIDFPRRIPHPALRKDALLLQVPTLSFFL